MFTPSPTHAQTHTLLRTLSRTSALDAANFKKSDKYKFRPLALAVLSVSAVFSSVAYGETVLNSPITDNSFNYSSGNLIISSGDNAAISGSSENINLSVVQDGSQELGNLSLIVDASHGVEAALTNSSKIIISAQGDISITVNGSNSDKDGDGINIKENNSGTVSFTGKSTTIHAQSVSGDGIYIDEGSSGTVSLTANIGNNSIFAENNGVDHRGSQELKLDAKGANIIQTTSGDGIRIDGKGSVILNAHQNEIFGGDNGIQVTNGQASLTADFNEVFASGDLTNQGNGIHSIAGSVLVSASQNNVITGKEKGIYVVDSNDVVISAENENIIGMFESSDGQTIRSKYGIYSDNSTVNISSGELTSIYGTEVGIHAHNNSNLTITGSTYIDAKQEDGSNADVSGVLLGVTVGTDSPSKLTITGNENQSANIHVIAEGSAGTVSAIQL